MMKRKDPYVIGHTPGDDYDQRIRRLRGDFGLTQQALADRLNVSFATVNRWENRQTKPSKLYWSQLHQLALKVAEDSPPYGKTADAPPAILDFTAQPEIVKVLAEGERLSFGHLMNPAFATEISSIDPLPHQRIAVYDHMLKQPRLRFLLADDAGAGKTIMSGLYIREMLSRRLVRRILIVPPAGLVGNWRREMLTLFNLPFRIVSGADAKSDNPFAGAVGDRVIVSVDTLSSSRVGAAVLIDPTSAGLTEGLDVPHNRPAGGAGLEHLPDETPEDEAQVENPIAATLSPLAWNQTVRRQEPGAVVL